MLDRDAGNQLEDILEWAKAKLAAGHEPPWAWYQYMKLVETIDAILAGTAAATTASSQLSEPRQETHLRLVDATCPQDDVPPRPVGPSPQMPM